MIDWIESEKITAGHAWRRWAARIFDSFVLGFLSTILFIIPVIIVLIILLMLIGGIISLVGNVEEKSISWMQDLWNYFVSPWSGLSVAYILYRFLVVFMVCLILLCFLYLCVLSHSLVVAVSMTCFGNTPGKHFMGIKILHETGRSITFKEAFKREMIISRKELYLLIPIIGVMIISEKVLYLFILIIGVIIHLIHRYKAYKNLIENKITTWDKQMHLTVRYRMQSVWVTLLAVIILIGLMYCYLKKFYVL